MIVAIALWIVVIAVAIFVESNTSTLVSMWFIPAGLVALILALLDMGFIWQFAAFAAISLICLILSRTAFRRMLTKGEQVLNNVDRLKGMDALVVSDISFSYGTGDTPCANIRESSEACRFTPFIGTGKGVFL